MRLLSHRPLILAALLAGAVLAAAQPPPPSPNGPPPAKQSQPPPAEGPDRRTRPRPAVGQLPMMDGVDMPEVAQTTEEPVTASGNVDLWRARIAERRAKQQVAVTSGGATPR
jgi:hypothetical protein